MRLSATDPRHGGPTSTPHGATGHVGDRCGAAVVRALLATWLVAMTVLESAAAPWLLPEPSRATAPLPLGAPTPAGPWLAAVPAKPAKASATPSAASQVALRKQALQALERGDLRRGCPLLRRAIDQTGALYARKPSPALEAELRGLLGRLQPCLRQGF